MFAQSAYNIFGENAGDGPCGTLVNFQNTQKWPETTDTDLITVEKVLDDGGFEFMSLTLTEGTLAEPTYVSVDWKVNFATACSDILTYEFMVGTCNPDLRLGLKEVSGA